MAFKSKKKQPDFSVLKKTLSQANPDNALYQTVQTLIEKLMQFQSVDADEKAEIIKTIPSSSGGGGGSSTGGNTTATYLTKNDETSDLSNSIQLMAGTNITFDDSIPNKRTINSSGGTNHYDSPLTDGDEDETDLIFASGECIIVQVPV